jgi:hypothetical protein
MANLILYLYNLSIPEEILVILSFLFLIEQLFYRKSGSYVYRYGLLVRRIPVTNDQKSSWRNEMGKYKRTSIKIDTQSEELYLRYKYSSLIVGPLLFIGQIQYNGENYLNLRIGLATTIFIIFLALYPIISGPATFNAIFNSFILIGLVCWLYFRFLSSIYIASSEIKCSKSPF